MIRSHRKSILCLILAFSVFSAHAGGIYRVFDAFGAMTDWLLTRGKLSDKNTQMFNDISKKLGIEDREIKVRNSGLLLRLFYQYNNALADQYANRVYINEDHLNELTDGEKQFLMAHELAHHKNHHEFKILGVGAALAFIQFLFIKAFITRTPNDGLIKKYLTHGICSPLISLLAINVSIWGLFKAMAHQHCETEADTHAVTVAHIDPSHGAALMKNMYYPNSRNWPLYGKAQAVIQRVALPVLALPGIKHHVNHLASYEDRVAHIQSLQVPKSQ